MREVAHNPRSHPQLSPPASQPTAILTVDSRPNATNLKIFLSSPPAPVLFSRHPRSTKGAYRWRPVGGAEERCPGRFRKIVSGGAL